MFGAAGLPLLPIGLLLANSMYALIVSFSVLAVSFFIGLAVVAAVMTLSMSKLSPFSSSPHACANERFSLSSSLLMFAAVNGVIFKPVKSFGLVFTPELSLRQMSVGTLMPVLNLCRFLL